MHPDWQGESADSGVQGDLNSPDGAAKSLNQNWVIKQSFRTLLAHLATRCRNTCVVSTDPNQTMFHQLTEADELQAAATRLLKM